MKTKTGVLREPWTRDASECMWRTTRTRQGTHCRNGADAIGRPDCDGDRVRFRAHLGPLPAACARPFNDGKWEAAWMRQVITRQAGRINEGRAPPA